jgi:3-oxoacyl-[acyl-carrier-protein] synthase-3
LSSAGRATGKKEVITQHKDITGNHEKRYVTDDLVTSDIAFFAAGRSGLGQIDGESLYCIVVAHNFSNIRAGNSRSAFVPALASKVKHP